MIVSRTIVLSGLITIIFIVFFTEVYSQSRSELILGTWVMEGKEYASNKLVMNFRKDSTSTMEKWDGKKFIIKLSFSYKISDQDELLSLEPLDSGSKSWHLGIVELNEQMLKLRPKADGSFLMVLTKSK